MKEITDSMLAELREAVRARMSAARFAHTLAVEDMTARLCALFCPTVERQMRAAALLHDLTKEIGADGQLRLCAELGLAVSETDRFSPKTFHARTAAAMIERDFEDYSDPIIVNAVRWHTTGCAEMTITDQVLYLADYIDDSRTFESCVTLRRHFWDADPADMAGEARAVHLYRVLLESFDMTIADLVANGKVVATDTLRARNALLLKLKKMEL